MRAKYNFPTMCTVNTFAMNLLAFRLFDSLSLCLSVSASLSLLSASASVAISAPVYIANLSKVIFCFSVFLRLKFQKEQKKVNAPPFTKARARRREEIWHDQRQRALHLALPIHTSVPLQSHIHNPQSPAIKMRFLVFLSLLLVACLAHTAADVMYVGEEMNASAIMHLAEQIDVHHVVVIMSQGRSGSTLLCNLVRSRERCIGFRATLPILPIPPILPILPILPTSILQKPVSHTL
jgi:hypothetical protein